MFDIGYFNKKGEKVSLEEWAKLCEDEDYRRVARTEFEEGEFVSTVLLGLDHNFSGKGPPKIFETMSHEKGEWVEQVRYCTEEQAKAGHEKVLERVVARRALQKHPYGRVVETDEATDTDE